MQNSKMAVGQIARGKAPGQPIEAALHIQHGADDPSHGQTDDEQHGKDAVRHVLHHGVNAETGCRQAHSREQSLLIFRTDAPTRHTADKAARHNGAHIDQRSQHNRFLPLMSARGKVPRACALKALQTEKSGPQKVHEEVFGLRMDFSRSVPTLVPAGTTASGTYFSRCLPAVRGWLQTCLPGNAGRRLRPFCARIPPHPPRRGSF